MKRILLVLSAIAFFCLQITTKLFAVGIVASVPFLLWFAVKRPEWARRRSMHWAGKVFCALTAMGISLWPIENFAAWLRSITVFQRLQSLLAVEMGQLSHLAAIGFAVVGLLFVYQMVNLFYERLYAVTQGILEDFQSREINAVLAVSTAVMAAVIAVYLSTDAFASPTVTRDLIYTADSGAIVHENAYLSLSALENDFRSPLFAVFAAPLLGLPYLIGRILPIPNAQALVMAAAQAWLLTASFVLLMKLIPDVSKPVRLLLPAVMLSTYSAMLFSVMAEQYVVALFYLSLGLYLLLRHGWREQLLVLGAAGAMLPGAALALVPQCREKKKTAILRDALKSAGWGLVLLCTMGCFGVVLRVPETLTNIGRFTGAEVAFSQRLTQYFSFVSQIFIAPQAGAVTAADGYSKWRLIGTGGHTLLGIVLLALALAGFIVNRRQTFPRISMAWVGLSFLLLCVMGWGTAENGLTLYTLYFGWAYAALLFYLIESLCRALKQERFSWLAYGLCTVAMLSRNLPAMGELLRFAVTNYPV